jgi:hypothetical protein
MTVADRAGVTLESYQDHPLHQLFTFNLTKTTLGFPRFEDSPLLAGWEPMRALVRR